MNVEACYIQFYDKIKDRKVKGQFHVIFLIFFFTCRIDTGDIVWGKYKIIVAVTLCSLQCLIALSWLAVTAVLHWFDDHLTIALHAWHQHNIWLGC